MILNNFIDYYKLQKDFYGQKTIKVAKELLGSYLVRKINGVQMIGRIVEVEAYRQDDPASHSYKGKTERNKVMFLEGGYLYVYFTFGMYHCANIVTENEGTGSAVLLRAVEPVNGMNIMYLNRKNCKTDLNLTNGPGKFCLAFQIDKSLNGANLLENEIFIVKKYRQEKINIESSTRIGITVGTDSRWRFFIRGNPYVSKHK